MDSTGQKDGPAGRPRALVTGVSAGIGAEFARRLADEVAGTGVRVQALCPGLVGDTEFHQHVPGFDPARPAAAPSRAADIVAASLAALELGEVICSPGLDDPALIDAFRDDEHELFRAAVTGRLAERYRRAGDVATTM